MNRLSKGVMGSPAWRTNLPRDLMVVQELGNIWPGWRGLGKGTYTPNRLLSPPGRKTSIRSSAQLLRRRAYVALSSLGTLLFPLMLYLADTHCKEGTRMETPED